MELRDKVARAICSELTNDPECLMLCNRDYQIADAAIAAVQEAGWQDIGDDFPHLPVLVSRPDGDGLRYTPTTAFNDATGVWRVFRSEGGMQPLPFVPTHFMPLPPPPFEGTKT